MNLVTKEYVGKKLIIALAGLLALVALVIYSYKIAHKSDYSDFDVYYRAGSRALAKQCNLIYNFKVDGASPFRYAPTTLLAFESLARLPFGAARQLWFYTQYLCFVLGFAILYRIIKISSTPRSRRKDTLWVCALSFLFVLRFCLDSFTIGQVSGIMFLAFCLSLMAWQKRQNSLAAITLFVPALLKIGPAFLFGLFLTTRSWRMKRSIVITSLACALASVLAAPSLSLWKGWFTIVAKDSVYYDASHYGSQSLNSAILRLVRLGWLDLSTAHPLTLFTTVLLCVGVLLFWLLRAPRSQRGKGLFFSLGILVYLLCMPETFKYSQVFLALPIAMILIGPMMTLEKIAFGIGLLTLSIAGLDIIGQTAFFGSQKASLPFLTFLLIGAATWRQALAESTPSVLSQKLKLYRLQAQPWPRFPGIQGDLALTILAPLPLDRLAPMNLALAEKHLHELYQWASSVFHDDFEILMIPYGRDFAPEHSPALRLSKKLADLYKRLRVIDPTVTPGRGAALRDGFIESQGKILFFTNLEQPCDVNFFQASLSELHQGYTLVRGNRRLASTEFRVPVSLLSLVHKRHQAGLVFNRLIRFMLPIATSDTQSGTLAIIRPLALHAFASQANLYSLFEIELELTAVGFGYRMIDLPVILYLESEKSRRRMFFETLSILVGLPTLALRFRNSCYHSVACPQAISADDWGLSPAINLGILELARLGVIKRVSLMANAQHLRDGIEELLSVPNIELGLHFNLTYGCPTISSSQLVFKNGVKAGQYLTPSRILLKWLFSTTRARTALTEEIRRALLLQLNALRLAGVDPQYIDGHHHIHLLPGLIDDLADLLKQTGIKKIRLPYDSALWLSSKLPLLILSLFARNALKRHGFAYFKSFYYPKLQDFLNQGRLRAKINKNNQAEIIVHPAQSNDLHTLKYGDSYTDGRVIEYRALRMLSIAWQSL